MNSWVRDSNVLVWLIQGIINNCEQGLLHSSLLEICWWINRSYIFLFHCCKKKSRTMPHKLSSLVFFFFFFLFTTKWPTPLIKKNKIKRKNRFPHLRPCLSQVKIFGKHNIISTPLRCCLDSHSFRQFQWIL